MQSVSKCSQEHTLFNKWKCLLKTSIETDNSLEFEVLVTTLTHKR